MTALEYDDLDAPIPFQLSEAGWAVHRGRWLTTGEAAERLGVGVEAVRSRLALGTLAGVRVPGGWLVDSESVDAVKSEARRVPSAPLLRWVRALGGAAALGVEPHSPDEKALERARLAGWVTAREADVLAVRVRRMTPWEVWGAAWDL